jgi:hypothetical protein
MVPPDIPETLRMSKFPTSVDLPEQRSDGGLVPGDRIEIVLVSARPATTSTADQGLNPYCAQCDKVTALKEIAPNLRAVLAAHVPFQLDGRRLWPAHNVQSHCLVGVAAEAADLNVKISRI